MIMLDSETAVVYNHNDLSDALTSNNGISYIYLGANITMNSGIRVDPAKPLAIIDGLYPPESGGMRVLVDSGASGGQIYMNSVTASRVDIIFRNLIINGRNFYGMPYIHDVAGAQNVNVTYEKVTFTGPQLIWHVRGLARIIDCEVTIAATAYSTWNEVAEINRVEIGGTTVIRHNNTDAYSVFYFYKANPYLKILEDADVQISTGRDFLFNEGSYYIPITLEPRASFSLTTRRGISRDSGHRAASFLVDEDASFRYIRETNAGDDHTLYVNGAFTVKERASVYMQADIANDGSMIRFMSSSARLDIDNPESFVIYNRGTLNAAAAFSFAAVTQLSLSAEQVNFWRDAAPLPAAGKLDDIPPRKWNRPDYGAFSLGGTAASSTSITSNDFTPEELAGLPALADLQLQQARVFSMGNLPLAVDPVVMSLNTVTGRTAGMANIRMRYVSGYVSPDGGADAAGFFSMTPDTPMAVADGIIVYSNTPFLIVTRLAEFQEEGELWVENAPEHIRFVLRPLSGFSGAVLPRHNYEEPVLIGDTRAPERTDWTLWARISGPLTADDGEVLEDAVVFALEGGSLIILGTEPLPVHTGEAFPEAEKSIVWDENRGVLARIAGPLRSRKEYSTTLYWSVYPVGIVPDDEGGDQP